MQHALEDAIWRCGFQDVSLKRNVLPLTKFSLEPNNWNVTQMTNCEIVRWGREMNFVSLILSSPTFNDSSVPWCPSLRINFKIDSTTIFWWSYHVKNKSIAMEPPDEYLQIRGFRGKKCQPNTVFNHQITWSLIPPNFASILFLCTHQLLVSCFLYRSRKWNAWKVPFFSC